MSENRTASLSSAFSHGDCHAAEGPGGLDGLQSLRFLLSFLHATDGRAHPLKCSALDMW